MRSLSCLLAVLLSGGLASNALASPPPGDAILSDLAQHVTHGFADYGSTIPKLEAKIATGEHVSVLCGQISLLGQRALTRAGIPSRLVGVFASQRYEMYDVPPGVLESHAMLEVWDGNSWDLYDLDSNSQPTDADGNPVTIDQFANMSPRYYRPIATDPLYDATDDQYPIYEQWLFDHHEEWYDRVLDIVTIRDGSEYIYTGAQDSPISDIKGYEWVDEQTYNAIAQAVPDDTPSAPSVAATPALKSPPAITSVSAPKPTPAATIIAHTPLHTVRMKRTTHHAHRRRHAHQRRHAQLRPNRWWSYYSRYFAAQSPQWRSATRYYSMR